jgi:hypothetical protein
MRAKPPPKYLEAWEEAMPIRCPQCGVALTRDEREGRRCGSCKATLPVALQDDSGKAERPADRTAGQEKGGAFPWFRLFLALGALAGLVKGAMIELGQQRATEVSLGTLMGHATVGLLMFALVGWLADRVQHQLRSRGKSMPAGPLVIAACSVVALFAVDAAQWGLLGHWSALVGGLIGASIVETIGVFLRGKA